MRKVDVAYCLISNDRNQILMVYNGDVDSWSMPGGLVEEGETIEQAAIREVYEETGLEVEINNMLAINECQSINKNEHAIFFTVGASIKGGSIEILNPNEITVVKWMDIEEADLLMLYHKDGISSIINCNAKYIDQGTYTAN